MIRHENESMEQYKESRKIGNLILKKRLRGIMRVPASAKVTIDNGKIHMSKKQRLKLKRAEKNQTEEDILKKFDVSILKGRVTEKRNELGMTQARLAEAAGITPAAISQIEKGYRIPTTPILRKIAKVLGVSMDYLAGQTDESEVSDIFQDEETLTLFRGLQSLHPDDKQTIFELTESLKARRKKELIKIIRGKIEKS